MLCWWKGLSARRRRLVVLFGLLALPLALKACSFYSYRATVVDRSHAEVRTDLVRRSAYLVERVHALEGDQDMPSLLGEQFQGEWAAVTYSMTAMALANLAFLYPDTAPANRAALEPIVALMLAPRTRDFDKALWNEDPLESLDGENGHIGYLGHLELVLLAHAYLGGDASRTRARDVAKALHRRMMASPALNAETYPRQTFIADNAVIVGALELAQRLFPEEPLRVTQPWVARARKSFLDPSTGLLVFRLDRSGEVIEQSRGSGAAWSVFYLSYADLDFAKEQYTSMHAVLASSALGPWVHGLREFPPGVDTVGDVDSGPVVMGLSPSGTGFAMAGATLSGDTLFLRDILRTAELVGTTIDTRAGRRYALAPLVGDAILLAMRTVTAWDTRFVEGRE